MSHSVPSGWYTDFFSYLPNEFWRRAVPPEATEADVDFIERELELAPGSRILDVPCGSGRHTLGLAARGHRVTGIDLSQEAIAHARSTAANCGLDVRFVQADMRETPQDGSYDAAVCMGNSFGYLHYPGLRDFVDGLSSTVRPGGGLVVDFMATAESLLPGYSNEPRTMQTGDITAVVTSQYDVANSCQISGYTFSRGDEVFTAEALHHVYTSAQIGYLLTDAGFTDIRRFAGPESSPYQFGSGRLLLTARRA
ncbi:class I SAM-dependent methyltransferase [Streptomyces sp. NPDC005500]|uniref:SAM-dependent methyltransferase n=1 Tax=Streptomyces sp. NPDC005500 TaxID=3155007 RepID=UPI0033AE1D79